MKKILSNGGRPAFTLIELLIVVAIIAILAAIAVPNFLEAQVRSKVSRCKADMRSLNTALEAYAVDYNKLPDVPRTSLAPPIKLGIVFSRAAFSKLSTPVSYMTSGLLTDPFGTGSPNTRFFGYANTSVLTAIDYTAVGAAVLTAPEQDELNLHRFVMQSVGPDKINYGLGASLGFPEQNFDNALKFLVNPQNGVGCDFIYDPTNGTVSTGDIVRTAVLTN